MARAATWVVTSIERTLTRWTSSHSSTVTSRSGREPKDSGVVHQHVDAAEGGDQRLGCGRRGRRIGEIGDLDAGRAEPVGDVLDRRIDIEQGDDRSLGAERRCDLLADATRCTGDQAATTLEPSVSARPLAVPHARPTLGSRVTRDEGRV